MTGYGYVNLPVESAAIFLHVWAVDCLWVHPGQPLPLPAKPAMTISQEL